jgi:arylsulfatase A-like enzyme
MYPEEGIELPANYMPEHPFDHGDLTIRDETLEAWPRRPDAVKRHIRDYYAIISHMDAQIGRILSALERSGLADGTIVVFAGDNGLAVGRHGLMGKQNLYEHTVKVPLLISGPGVQRGRRSEAFVYLSDIMPTLCELASVPVPASVDTLSLLPVIRNPQTKVRETLFFAYRDFQRAVRDRRCKLIEYNVKGKRTTQLFDLQRDPLETENLAADPAYQPVLARLRTELARWQQKTGDRSSF